jgi:hypothetical protein
MAERALDLSISVSSWKSRQETMCIMNHPLNTFKEFLSDH